MSNERLGLNPEDLPEEYVKAVLDHPDFVGPVAEELKQSPEGLRKFVEIMTERNRESERRANHDRVTGLPNRHAFDEKLVDLEPFMRRYGGQVLWIDMEGLSRFNNEYGHHVGDEALKKLSQAMRVAFRSYELPFRSSNDEYKLPSRTGGDEFGALLIGVDSEKVVSRLEAELSKPRYRVEGEPIQIYYGAAEVRDGESIKATLKRAQRAQAQDKRRKKTASAD